MNEYLYITDLKLTLYRLTKYLSILERVLKEYIIEI